MWAVTREQLRLVHHKSRLLTHMFWRLRGQDEGARTDGIFYVSHSERTAISPKPVLSKVLFFEKLMHIYNVFWSYSPDSLP